MIINIEITEKTAYPLREGTIFIIYKINNPLAIPVMIISIIFVSVKFEAKYMRKIERRPNRRISPFKFKYCDYVLNKNVVDIRIVIVIAKINPSMIL